MGILVGWIITIIIEILIISGFVSGGADNAGSIIGLLILCAVVAIPMIKITKEKMEENNNYYSKDNQFYTSNVNVQSDYQEKINYFTKVVGVTMDDTGKSNLNCSRQTLIKQLNVGNFLIIKHEENNKFDKNAISVYNSENQMLGYISKSINSIILKELLDNNIDNVVVKNITGGQLGRAFGLNIEIKFFEPIKVYKKTNNNAKQTSYISRENHTLYDDLFYWDNYDFIHEMENNSYEDSLYDDYNDYDIFSM